MKQWEVRAVSANGSVMTFGLSAVDREAALVKAIDRVPFQASHENVSVTEVIMPPIRRLLSAADRDRPSEEEAPPG